MLNRRTLILSAFVAAVLVVANAIPLTIPFVGEQEADGIMTKTGWPCSFREETRHRVFFEWRDVILDAAVAVSVLVVVAAGSEWVVRSSARGGPFSYADYSAAVMAAAVMTGINLHEHTTAATTTRGFPLAALISDPSAVHHNRVEFVGAFADVAVAATVVICFLVLARKLKTTA